MRNDHVLRLWHRATLARRRAIVVADVPAEVLFLPEPHCGTRRAQQPVLSIAVGIDQRPKRAPFKQLRLFSKDALEVGKRLERPPGARWATTALAATAALAAAIATATAALAAIATAALAAISKVPGTTLTIATATAAATGVTAATSAIATATTTAAITAAAFVLGATTTARLPPSQRHRADCMVLQTNAKRLSGVEAINLGHKLIMQRVADGLQEAIVARHRDNLNELAAQLAESTIVAVLKVDELAQHGVRVALHPTKCVPILRLKEHVHRDEGGVEDVDHPHDILARFAANLGATLARLQLLNLCTRDTLTDAIGGHDCVAQLFEHLLLGDRKSLAARHVPDHYKQQIAQQQRTRRGPHRERTVGRCIDVDVCEQPRGRREIHWRKFELHLRRWCTSEYHVDGQRILNRRTLPVGSERTGIPVHSWQRRHCDRRCRCGRHAHRRRRRRHGRRRSTASAPTFTSMTATRRRRSTRVLALAPMTTTGTAHVIRVPAGRVVPSRPGAVPSRLFPI